MDVTPSPGGAHGRLRKVLTRLAIAIAALLAIIAIFGFFVAPRIVKWKGEEILTRELHRPTTIEHVAINPFTLSGTVRNLEVKEKDGATTAFSLEEIHVKASYTSILRFAPVVDRVRLTKPYVHLVRFPDRKYNVQDLIDAALAPPAQPPPPDAKPPRFSVFNIQVLDGRVDFDDQVVQEKHAVTELKIGIPFISSLPYAREIEVQPEIAARLNGAAVGAKGETTPFKDRKETTLAIDVDDLPLPQFVDYSPVPLRFDMTSGLLDTRIRLVLTTVANQPQELTLSGTAAVSKVKLVDRANAPLLGWERASIDLEKLDVLGQVANVRSVRLEQPDVDARRAKDGSINLLALVPELPPASKAAPARTAAAPTKPFQFRVDEVLVTGGKVHAEDNSLQPRPFVTDLHGLEVAIKGLSSEDGKKAEVTSSFDTDGLGRFTHAGTLQARPALAMEGRGEATGFRLGRIYPYIEPILNLEIADGTLDAAASYALTDAAGGMDLRVFAADATVKSLLVNYPGDKEPVARVPLVQLRGAEADLNKRQVTIAECVANDGVVNARRDPDGTINFARFLKQVDAKAAVPAPAAAHPPAEGSAEQTGSAAPAAPPWRLDMKRVAVDNFAVTIEDRVPKPVVVTKLTNASVAAENWSNYPGTTANLTAKATVNGKGTVAATGPFTSDPFATELKVETKAINFAVLQPYFDEQLNIALTSGLLSTRGTAKVSAPPGKPVAIAYRGDVNVSNFASIDKASKEDFLNWKSLYLGGVDFVLQPLKVNVNEVALSDFFARVILSADGRLNLQDVVRQPGQAARSVTETDAHKRDAAAGTSGAGTDVATSELQSGAASRSAPAEPSPAGSPALEGSGGENAAASAGKPPPSRTAAGTAATRTQASGGDSLDDRRRGLAAAMTGNVRIGRITLQGGNVNFSDFFVRPNYRANLTGIGGTVTEMTATKAGDVELRGKVDKVAPIEILGRVNALSTELFVDLAASATDIELPPLSPYAIKYAGYGIERGKMTMKVKYLIEDRKLTADNNVYLDQLTFGEKVESPTATKLPVLLAVSLLKDRNGVIDIDLPISGSIDDPQFSIWGIIGRVILNLLTKAITAPFSVLASVAGSKEELSYVEFEPGSSALDSVDEGKLKSLAKALDDRPQLRLDVGGRVDPDGDREALRAGAIQRKVRQQKWQELRREGRAPPSADEVVVDKGEYEKYLRLAYRAEDFPKPRNAIGLVKDLPVAEMENLMLTNAPVSDEDLRVLANQRAQAAKDWIVENGKIPADRVFLVAPKLTAEDVKEKGKATRAEFSIK
jgi:uncharacterized protein involved in outer membrane biogenesis